MTETLFDGYEPVMPQPAEKISADRQRTIRQHALVAQGIHPLTKLKARPDLGTCGECVHRLRLDYHRRTYAKCDAGGGVRMTHSAASDVRAWWPACEQFQAVDPWQPLRQIVKTALAEETP